MHRKPSFPSEFSLRICAYSFLTALTVSFPSNSHALTADVSDEIEKLCLAPSGDSIPTIARVERSDWINVKTDVEPHAVGDGVNDDTTALQNALAMIGDEPGEPKVVYLPPGNYKITQTLAITERHGGMLIGHGKETKIIWDGRTGGRMLWSNGAARQTYDGLIWDGNNKAAVGIDHDSKNLYETRVLHENMEFRKFKTAGIRVGHDQKLASAEMLFSNLKFVQNEVGVLFQAWNDYNNLFDGCHFIDNGYGIHAEKGNINVRNSRFQNSTKSDLFLSTHSHSFRRVISTGSNSFIRTVRGPISNGLIRVENSRIDNWKNTNGAIISELRGPIVVFDTVFTRPPGRKAPILLDQPPYMNQISIVSNVHSKDTDAIVDAGPNDIAHSPAATRDIPPIISLDQTFLRGSNDHVGTLLDVKQDCGAAGNGRKDDTAAIQRCMDSAASENGTTTVYFPSGTYRVTKTLQARSGAAYRIEGTGWHSRIIWSAKLPGTLLHIHNPSGMTLEHLTFGGPPGTISLHQTGDQVSSIKYHNVFGYYDDERKDEIILFESLPSGSTVVTNHLDGRVIVRDSSAATILFGFLLSVQMTVEGNSPQNGFLGVLTRVSALERFPLVIRDNQSLVMTDWYNEQTHHLAYFSGHDNIQGQVILDHTQATNDDSMAIKIDGYSGLIAHFGGMFGPTGEDGSREIIGNSAPNSDTLFVGNMFWYRPLTISVENARTHLIGNSINKMSSGLFSHVEDVTDARSDTLINSALDAFREIGKYDLLLNYCTTSTP